MPPARLAAHTSLLLIVLPRRTSGHFRCLLFMPGYWYSDSERVARAHCVNESPPAYHRQNIVSVLHSGHNVCSFAQYVEKLLDSLGGAENYFRLRRKGG